MKNFNYPGQAVNPSLNRAGVSRPAATKTVPFDYVFQFALKGERGNKVQDVVEISMEGVFVALSVGYSLVQDEKSVRRTFSPVLSKPNSMPVPALLPFFPTPAPGGTALPNLTGVYAVGTPGAEIDLLLLSSPPPIGVPLNVVPGGTALALSPLPQILGSAIIGKTGIATIEPAFQVVAGNVICIRDKTNDILSQPFEIGNPATPSVGPNFTSLNQADTIKTSPAAGVSRLFIYGFPDSRVRVTLLEKATGLSLAVKNRAPLPGTINDSFTLLPGNIPNNILNPPQGRTAAAEVPLSFDDISSSPSKPVNKNLSSGDVVFIETLSPVVTTNSPFGMFIVPPNRSLSDITLGELEASLEKNGADLTRGFRLNLNSNGLAGTNLPLDRLSANTSEKIFETGSVPAEEVSFLYSLDIGGTGREYQNKAIHNIAGLGIANGDRPFRPFAKPILFEPRSFIRIQIEELSRIPGTLFVVLQGYKMLGTSQAPM